MVQKAVGAFGEHLVIKNFEIELAVIESQSEQRASFFYEFKLSYFETIKIKC